MDEPADTHALLAAYVLNAVDDAERAAVERHLAACEDCRDDVREARETLAQLAHGVAAPPPAELKEQLLRRVRETPQDAAPPAAAAADQPSDDEAPVDEAPDDEAPDGEVPDGAPTPTPPRVPSPRGPQEARVPWIVAVVAVVLAAGLGGLAWTEHRSALDASRRAAAASGESAALLELQGVVADPAAARVSGRTGSGGLVTAFVTTGGSAVLTSGLPGLPTDRTYQLWSVRGAQISSLGLGASGPTASGGWQRLVSGVRPGDVLAISVEPVGGSRQPTTTPILALRTPAS